MKKKLLAGILSFTMLAGQVLPVVAADDADVAVSENETVVEESAEEAAEETAEDESVETEAVEAEVDNDITDSIPVEGELEEFGTAELVDYNFSNVEAFNDPSINLETNYNEIVGASTPINDHIGVGQYQAALIDAGTINIDGVDYNLSAEISYYNIISYRGRKIKADELYPTMTKKFQIYDLAEKFTTKGVYSDDIITLKYSAKKNKDCTEDSYITVKASVNSKVAKKLGIKGKSLSKLKKAVKQFNKVAKKQHLPFSILQINADYLWATNNMTAIGNYSGWIFLTFKSFRELRARLDVDQPAYKSSKDYWKKWTKLSKKDFTIEKVKGEARTYLITPKGRNFTGSPVKVTFGASM